MPDSAERVRLRCRLFGHNWVSEGVCTRCHSLAPAWFFRKVEEVDDDARWYR